MRYQISGQQIKIGDALQVHVQNELGEVAAKYAQRPTDATVLFSRNAHEYMSEITVHLSTGLNAAATAKETEIYAAFDSCLSKLEKQLRRYKRRLKDHHRHRAQPVELSGHLLTSYLLPTQPMPMNQTPCNRSLSLKPKQRSFRIGRRSRYADGNFWCRVPRFSQ